MKLILFGAGYCGREAYAFFGEENVFCFCDNKIAENDEGELYGKRIISFRKLLQINKEFITVVCVKENNGYYEEITGQLDEAGIEYLDFTVLQQMSAGGEMTAESFAEQIQDELGRERIFKKYYKILFKKIDIQLQYLKRHAEITTLKPAIGELRKRQLQLLDFVEEFFDFISEIEIFPFLNFGNLIGAVRHQGFIPWDDDIDFGIMRDDYERLIAFVKQRCIVGTRCGEWGDSVWLDQSGKEYGWPEIFEKFPDRYVCDIRSDMLQIFDKGVNSGQSMTVDIWAYDYYRNDYDIADHKKWLEKIAIELQGIKCEKDKVAYLNKERKNNPMVSRTKTGNIYPGIDNFGGYPGLKTVDRWIPYDDIFPLRKIKYENKEFWAPNHMESLLAFEYNEFMEFPHDMGVLHSGILTE